MPCPLTPLQAYQNRRFLDRFGLSGNARLAAREVGVAYGTMQHRRKAHAAFAQAWEAAAVAVHARLHLAGGKRGPEPARRSRPGAAGGRGARSARSARDDGRRQGFRTRGGEPMVVRTRSGRLQIRLAHPNKLTKAAEQAFLHALSATANVRLSAAAAGASARAFYRRRRKDPAVAREFRLALKMGWERLEMAALQASLPQSHADDQWRNCRPAPLPRFTADQAIQLLVLHEKSVWQMWEQPHRRRRRGESDETHSIRLQAMWRAEKSREAEAEAMRRAARYEESGGWRHEDEVPPPELPPLDQVTGWSRAKGGPAHRPGLALFGGWRIEEMERKLGLG